MTTDELLASIEHSKKRDDVIRAYSACLPCWPGVNKKTVDAAITTKWSAAGLTYIRQKAWRIRDTETLKAARERSETPGGTP